jgi:hypothetical protein
VGPVDAEQARGIEISVGAFLERGSPTICIIIRPAGVAVSTDSVRLRKPAFFPEVMAV